VVVSAVAATAILVPALARPAGAAPARPAAAVTGGGLAGFGWGSGAVGNDSRSPQLTPQPIVGFSSGIRQVAAGDRHSLAVRTDGSVWAWGDNSSGQVGFDEPSDYAYVPVHIQELSNMIQVSGGYSYSLALRSDGTVWAWGANDSGELGDGGTNQSFSPVRVSGLTGITQISAGGGHALALRSDGTVWAWGDNTWGELGVAGFTATMSTVPRQVSGIIGATQVSAGEAFSLCLLSDGTVRAFGENAAHELGDGTTITRGTPVRVTGLSGVTQVDAGWVHGLARRGDGTVWSWGSNAEGELGDGTTTDRPVAAAVPNLSGATQVSAGVFDSFAVLTDGTVRAWGANPVGELGDGTETQDLVPEQVLGFTNAVQVDAGFGATVATADVPGFSISLGQQSGTITAGGSVSTPVSLSPVNGFIASATLTASGLPSGVTASFSPARVSAGGSATLTLATAPDTVSGTYPVTVTATDASGATRTATYQLTITTAVPFTLTAALDDSDPVGDGIPVRVQVQVTPKSWYAGSAVLSVTGVPACATASFSRTEISSGGATLTLTPGSCGSDSFSVTVVATPANAPATPPLAIATANVSISFGGPPQPDTP
jgi:alpha-tubulin suppressor-like RCC1 family protein